MWLVFVSLGEHTLHAKDHFDLRIEKNEIFPSRMLDTSCKWSQKFNVEQN